MSLIAETPACRRARRQTVPTPVQAARLMFAALAVGQLVDLIALACQQSTSMTGPLLLHIPLFFLSAVLVATLPTGSPWALRPATVSQLVGVMFSVVLWNSSLNYRPLVPAMDIIGIAAVALLWSPPQARGFFREAASRG